MTSSRASSLAVIMPVRDAAATFGAAIASVVEQVPAGTDVLVVDGSSADDCRTIASQFSGVRVLAQASRGLAAARNQGLAATDAEIIGFCDADDRWAADALASSAGYLAAHNDCDVVVGHVAFEADARETLTDRQRNRLGQHVPGFTPGAMLARRAVFDLVGPFDTGMSIACDSDWFVRLRESAARVHVLNTVVLHKSIRAGSLSADVGTYRRELLHVARGFLDRNRGRSAT